MCQGHDDQQRDFTTVPFTRRFLLFRLFNKHYIGSQQRGRRANPDILYEPFTNRWFRPQPHVDAPDTFDKQMQKDCIRALKLRIMISVTSYYFTPIFFSTSFRNRYTAFAWVSLAGSYIPSRNFFCQSTFHVRPSME